MTAPHDFSIRCVGTGSYAPETVLTNQDIEQRMDTNDAWIQKTYGIRERRVASPTQQVSDLSCEAAKRALDAAMLGPEQIDLIIHASINNDVRVPATACIVQGRLGCDEAVAFDINLGGCPNTAFALTTAIKYLDGVRFKRALVICTEIYSKFINWSYRSSACFLGDGSGAVVLETGPGGGPLACDLHTAGSQYAEVVWAGGGTRQVDPEEQTPIINGRVVWDFGHRVVPEVIRTVIASAGFEVDDVDFFIFHQANINMIRNNMAALGVPPERTHMNNDRFGNTGGASSLIALDEAVRLGKIPPKSRVVLCSYGAGLAWGAVLFEYRGR
ncbi:MAG: ketoacyl-ACP synthase III [Micromonosporaceae bacterium]|nr:ketoacyl-ACP synthase III [Micromonosporaceae bacterium]